MTLHSSSKTPNQEQEKAIFHKGGKLLSAGAGSGKTFVLIEHLIHLITDLKNKEKSENWGKRIASELSKTVLMTFTKKAAGEMSVRMMRRVDEIILNINQDDFPSDYKYWTLVRQNLSYFNITTIHGFCHRLLRMGFWSNFPQEINLVSGLEHKDKIQKIFEQWLETKKSTLDAVFLASSDSLLLTMCEIFSSPELRVLWSNPQKKLTANEEIDQFFTQLIEIKNYQTFFETEIELSTSEKDKSKKWHELLASFDIVMRENGIINSANYKRYGDYFSLLERFPASSAKEITSNQKIQIEYIKELREDLKDFAEDLEALSSNYQVYQKWVETIYDSFQYINLHYFEVDGFSFSDLEFYVLEGLKDQDVVSKIKENFSYFIVDEFQDTSFVQFEILKKLMGDDPEKIFCVGDRKQAIYGFRGGELQVFSDCSNLLGQSNNYYLKNNFRSSAGIISYNNDLFGKVFPLGLKFKGSDPHSVEMEPQVAPTSNELEAKGGVFAIEAEVIGDIKTLNLDQLESIILKEHIDTLLQDPSCKSICILYRKLKPSAFLLELLLTNEIAFGAQVKVNYAEDPLINIFVYLLEIYLNRNNNTKSSSSMFLLKTLLNIIDVQTDIDSHIEQFCMDTQLMGLRLAFTKFLSANAISNSLHEQNAELISAICKITHDDAMKAYCLLKSDDGNDYSFEMINGGTEKSNGKRITIMSAHASKGLEFDAVLLGGVHTNGRYSGMRNLVGKWPHSFKWKKSFDQKHFFKSPFYYLESMILALKDFSESKRLLYVACTRAVKHLAYVDLWYLEKGVEKKKLFENENSWIQAMRLGECEKLETLANGTEVDTNEISLIQRDSMGIVVNKQAPALGLISELSVTRLATIANCPFKFYLQNICKIEVEKNSSFRAEASEDDEEEIEIFHSSKKRGTAVHDYLSKFFLKQITLNQVPAEEKEKISWAYQLASKFTDDYDIVSEKMIKFSFFGQMISGTPDLVFINNMQKIVVWDFKTGLRDSENESSYWFQLMCYGYAYAKKIRLSEDSKIELSLLYLDQSDVVTKTFSVEEITQLLFTSWRKTEFLNQVNREHCAQCEYSSICRKGENSTHFSN